MSAVLWTRLSSSMGTVASRHAVAGLLYSVRMTDACTDLNHPTSDVDDDGTEDTSIAAGCQAFATHWVDCCTLFGRQMLVQL